MDFALMPPEINSGLVYAGPGSGPMLAAAAGWDAVAAELDATAGGYASQLADLTGLAWFGPSSMLMKAAATPYLAWLQASAAQAGQTATQAYTAAGAYELAFAMTVPPPVIAANRAQLAVLVATNFLGQNTPAIAATEAHYTEMWVQDATAMYAYAGDSAAASTLAPFNEPPQTTNRSGSTDQARELAQSATNTSQHTVTNTLAQLVDPTLQPGNTITLAGGTVHLGAGVSVQVPSGFPNGFATSSGVTIDITQGSTATGESGIVTLSPGGYFYPATSGMSFTVESGTIYASGNSPAAYVTVTNAAVDVTGVAGTFSVNPATGALTATGSVTAIPAPITPVAPVTAGSSGLAAAPAATASPGLAGTSAIQPQLNAELLTEWFRGITTADLAAAGLG